ncbi:MAG: endonuclease/exonuclease/phosphatase family metal-dependent hydrolase [Pirellulaceae bacterium]|jgi:endonuclease/exonuclease/phosphatase family metal-dependent hydrolase
MQHFHFALALIVMVGCDPPDKPMAAPPPTPTPPPSVTSEPADGSLLIVGWNVESGGNDPEVIAAQLKTFAKADIFCLSEVHPNSLQIYEAAMPTDFGAVNTKTGGGDRLQILFNRNRFELLEEKELHIYGDHKLNDGNHRSPLYVRLKDRDSQLEFIVMTNHLARGKAEIRKQQAIGLREWARGQSVPVVAVGDFNMDYHYEQQKGNEAFAEMLRDNVWHWVRPSEPIDSNWADRDEDGKDDYPGSVLDFAFVAGAAKEWKAVCNVIVRDGDFPDDDKTSDHRPVELHLTP